MKFLKVLSLSVLVLFLASLSMAGIQEQSKEDQKMMETWKKYATPSQGHKFLQKFVGQWEATTKTWTNPGKEPAVSNGPATGELLLGGRYVKMSYKGTMMGMPFEGFGIHAYDNHIEKYLSTWVDNMGTGIMFSTGIVDASGKVLTEIAEIDDIFTGKKAKAKTVTTFVNPDKFIMEMFMVSPQGEFKNLEVTHTRKK